MGMPLFQRSLNWPPPKKETLSRHSILGPNGLSGSVWSPPKAEFKAVKMMDELLRLAQENTRNNLETCGVRAGSLKNKDHPHYSKARFNMEEDIFPLAGYIRKQWKLACSKLTKPCIFNIALLHHL